MKGHEGENKIQRDKKKCCFERGAGWEDQCVLRWFGNVESMEDRKLVMRIMRPDVCGGGLRGRVMLSADDCVKRALGERGMALQQARATVHERSERRLESGSDECRKMPQPC